MPVDLKLTDSEILLMKNVFTIRISVDTLTHKRSPAIVKSMNRQLYRRLAIYPLKRADIATLLDCLALYADTECGRAQKEHCAKFRRRLTRLKNARRKA